MGDRELSHSVLIIFHVFFSNILLMNYLIAILSTTYENMKQSGIFRYKVNLYQYCERFMIAFEDRTYGEIVLHPPPLSYLSTILLPFMVNKTAIASVSAVFSKMMFWLENVFFIFCFFGFEFFLAIFAYIKVWLNLVKNSVGVLNLVINCLIWAVFGLLLIFYLIFKDCYYLCKILLMHNGCRYGKFEDMVEEEAPRSLKIRVFNETRSTVISVYKRLQKHINNKLEEGEGAEGVDEEDEDEDPDFF